MGGATHEKSPRGESRARKRRRKERLEEEEPECSQLLCLVTFVQNMIAARFGVGMVWASLQNTNKAAAGCLRVSGRH